MPWSLVDIRFALPVYALILFRLSGLVLTAPVIGSSIIPFRIRAAFVLVLSAMLFPLVSPQAPGTLPLALAAIGGVKEMTIGAVIGLSLTLMLMGAEVAGITVGQQAGLALSRVFDPTQNRQTNVIAQIYTIVLTLVFLSIGGHRAMLAAALDSFQAIPLMSFEVDESLVAAPVHIITAALIVGIRLAGPVLIALLLMGTAMGFLSRTMPQFNILSVGFTLRAMVGLGAAGLAITAGQDVLVEAVWEVLAVARNGLGLGPFGAVGG